MRTTLCAALLVCAGLSGPARAHAAGRVLLVHSYAAGSPWTDGVTRGVQQALSDAGVTLEAFYMDAGRRPDAEWKA